MAFVETLDPFFADFAVSATIGGSTVSGIFDNAYQGSFEDLVGDTAPAFTCKTADLPAITPGSSTVTVTAGTFTVAAVEPDGLGVTVLRLK